VNPKNESGQSASGYVFQINVSRGGVPKTGRVRSDITTLGLSEDRQRDAKLHGGEDRAVCLYSLERILSLQRQGHPVFPGAMGENLTLTGLDWAVIQPGVRLRIGEALLETSGYTNPCSNLEPFFLNGDYSRVSQKANPGWSRLYARVLQPGRVQIGDPVQVLP
jgi:MOSC domain-containing protein YiiM